jgi:hypothetical protein
VATRQWALQRGYASIIYPSKRAVEPEAPRTYALKTDTAFRQALSVATEIATRRPMSSILLSMDDNREHPVRDSMLKLAFGQTRTPLSAMGELASRLAMSTDKRTRPALFVVTIDEDRDASRVSMYVFPEESTYALKSSAQEPTEAVLEHLNSFVLESRLRKVARFEGKNIKTHFISGEVVDLQIGSGPRSVADYWVADFLQAEFAINDHKGTTLVAQALKAAFQKADPRGKQKVMEAAIALMASGRRAWSIRRIADEFIPADLSNAFCSVAPNVETLGDKFMLNKDLLRDRINYRVFQLETGVWVSSPFSEVGRTVKVEDDGRRRTLTARGVIKEEKVQRDAKRPPRD